MTTAAARVVLGVGERGEMVLDLPELLTAGAYIQGNSGSGKSGLIRRLLEQSHGRVQQMVLDAEGDYATLAQGFDFVVCGRDFEVTASLENPAALAVTLYGLGVSAVIDLHYEEIEAQRRYVRDFVNGLMTHAIRLPQPERHHLLLVIDEVQLFAPQNAPSVSSAAISDLSHRGRKFGLHPVLATQRLATVDNDAVSEVPNKFFGRTSLDTDQTRVMRELGVSGKEARQMLRTLERRQFLAFGPALSDGSEPTLFTVGDALTMSPLELTSFTAPTPSAEVLEALRALGGGTPPESEGAPPPAEAGRQERRAPAAGRLGRSNGVGPSATPPASDHPAAPACGHEEEIAHLERMLKLQGERVAQLEEEVGAERAANDRVYETFIRNRDRLHDQVSGLIRGLSFIEEKDDAKAGEAAARPDGVAPAHAGVRRAGGREGSARPRGTAAEGERPAARPLQREAKAPRPAAGRDTEDMKDEEVDALLEAKLSARLAGGAAVLVVTPAEVIRKEYQARAVERVLAKVAAIPDDDAEVVRFMLGQQSPMAPGRIANALGLNNIQIGAVCKRLTDQRIVKRGGAAGGGTAYSPRLQDWVAEELAAHSPKPEEVEAVYQAVLGRIAGGAG